MVKHRYSQEDQYLTTLLVGIDAPYNKTKHVAAYFDEFISLVKTSGVPYEETLFIHLRTIDPAYFLTKGKLHDLKKVCEDLEIEHVIFSDQLNSKQERNLTDFLNCRVTDRTGLILDIFEKAALSAEGKAQVTIAKMQYLKTRLAGKGAHLSQQAGAIGLRSGPGETLKETERRHIENTILKNKRHLATLQKTRALQRKQRLTNKVPHICLIGYTNAGKSTLLNLLTKSKVLAEDKLFATLDTTTRELYVNGQKKGVISDTVGFIQQLPHGLVEAFKSTLSELQYADLLLHVIDSSDPNWQEHIEVVHEILKDLGVHKDILYVFNKIDKLESLAAIEHQLFRYEPNVVISAQSKDGIEELIEYLDEWEVK